MRQGAAEARQAENDGPASQPARQKYFGDELDAGVQHSMKAVDSGDRNLIADIDPQEIAVAAYLRWESGGRVPGTADDDWFRAEHEIKSQREATPHFWPRGNDETESEDSPAAW